MTCPIPRDLSYRRRRFEAATVQLWVRWYVTYRFSYRDLSAILVEQGRGASYRGVDKYSKSVNFPLRPDRAVPAAQAFSRKALKGSLPRWPTNFALDGFRSSHHALRREDPKWKFVRVRTSQYLNNMIEQDHRDIKRRCAWITGSPVSSHIEMPL